MVCDAPPQPPQQFEPPAWHFPAPGTQVESVMLGFVTFGTPEQIQAAGLAVESQGLRCGIIRAEDGRTELMVIFDQATTQQTAYSVYWRVFAGEFGTTGTAYMLAPVTSLKGK